MLNIPLQSLLQQWTNPSHFYRPSRYRLPIAWVAFIWLIAMNVQAQLIVPTPHPTADAAAIAAGNFFNPISISEDREFIGTILQHAEEGYFIYTVTPGERFSGQASTRLIGLKGYHLRAFWHTHGAEHWSRKYFSTGDTRLVKQWQLPLYMADPFGNLKVHRPGDPLISKLKARKLGLDGHRGFSEGITVTDARGPVKLLTHMRDWQALAQRKNADQGKLTSSPKPTSHSMTTMVDSWRLNVDSGLVTGSILQGLRAMAR